MQKESKLKITKNYWNCQTDTRFEHVIYSIINKVYWHQIKRYLKILNPATNLDSIARGWKNKVELLYLDFVIASMSDFKPGKNVSVGKQFILSKK